MRSWGKVFVVVSIAMAGVSLAVGQPPFQPGGFGGKGKGVNDYFSLAQNGQVKDELKLTAAQIDKLPAAALKALGEVLDAKQLARLKQIYLQNRGIQVYLEADVKKDLKITPDQAGKIQAAIDNQAKEQKAMFESGGFDFEKMQELQKTTTDTVLGVLTPGQKTAWEKMTGEHFEMKGFGKKKG